jgi:uncharacterized protein (DUF3084 family)
VEAAVVAPKVRDVEDDAWRHLAAARQELARTVSQAEDLSRLWAELVAAASFRHLVADMRNSVHTQSGMLTAQRPEARRADMSGIELLIFAELDLILLHSSHGFRCCN